MGAITPEQANRIIDALDVDDGGFPEVRNFVVSLTAPGGLAEMEARKDAAYLERNQVVAALARVFPSGIARTAIEGWSEDWHGCVYIDLPTGQASWHYHDSHAYLFDNLPPYKGTWDGHTTGEKYKRLADLKPSSMFRFSAEELDLLRTILTNFNARCDTTLPSGEESATRAAGRFTQRRVNDLLFRLSVKP